MSEDSKPKKHAHGVVFDDATEAALDWLRATTSIKAVTLIKLAIVEYADKRGYGRVVTTGSTNPPGAVRERISPEPKRLVNPPAPVLPDIAVEPISAAQDSFDASPSAVMLKGTRRVPETEAEKAERYKRELAEAAARKGNGR